MPTNVPPTESQPRKTLLNGKRDTGPQKAAQEGLSLKLKEKGEETEKLTESKTPDAQKQKRGICIYILYNF